MRWWTLCLEFAGELGHSRLAPSDYRAIRLQRCIERVREFGVKAP